MKTLIIIAALVIAASALYFADNGAFPWEAQSGREPVYFQEDNGVLGRIFDFGMNLTWNLPAFAMASSGTLAGVAGVALYWRKIED